MKDEKFNVEVKHAIFRFKEDKPFYFEIKLMTNKKFFKVIVHYPKSKTHTEPYKSESFEDCVDFIKVF